MTARNVKITNYATKRWDPRWTLFVSDMCCHWQKSLKLLIGIFAANCNKKASHDLVRLVKSHYFDLLSGTPGRNRTCDLRIRNPSLYPLSYGGTRTMLDFSDHRETLSQKQRRSQDFQQKLP